MTKPVRSPILGYNHNIRFHGHVFHVQTEDSGAQHARLFTHLFVGGTILASKKEAYEATAPEDAVRLLMQRLHKSMIKELKDGVHDPSIQGFLAARGEQVQLGDRPSLVQVPAAPPATADGALAVVAGESPAQIADDRPRAVSGSIDTLSPPAPAPVRKPVVVFKPPEVKRPPVVVTSSAEGVVVRRNVVINVGGGSAPVQGQISRGTAIPRPAVPYVVREGSYPMPTVSRGTSAHAAPPPPAEPSPAPSARDVRMPWDAPASGEPVPRAQTPSPPPEHTPTSRVMGSGPGLRTRPPGPPSERTPTESAFSTDLPSDKSLDEVILEYLSDDPE
jgi:hypothetical protein